MTRNAFICLAILLLGSLALAASSSEAITFVENTNHLLVEGESTEIFPVVKISHSRADHWVVSVLSDSSTTGFIPIKDAKNSNNLAIAEGSLARRQLIKTAHYLRLYTNLKNGFSQQGSWVLRQLDIEFFNSLSNDLKNERVDLTTIESELDDYTSLQIKSAALRSQLNELHPLASDIANSISDFKQTEAKFFADPDTNFLNKFVASLDEAFVLIKSFDSKRSDYRADLDELTQGIAQTDLSLETKSSLYRVANPPQSLNEVSSRVNYSINLQEKLDEAFSSALNQSNEFVQDLSVREKRSSAWLALYAFDEDILEKTTQRGLQDVDSLNELVQLILKDDYLYIWKDQAEVQRLQESWGKAKAYFDSGSFDSSLQFSSESKKRALKVFKGYLEEPEPVVNTDLLVTGAVLLIIAVIVLYALRNRGKLSALVSAQEEEEVSLHEWDQ